MKNKICCNDIYTFRSRVVDDVTLIVITVIIRMTSSSFIRPLFALNNWYSVDLGRVWTKCFALYIFSCANYTDVNDARRSLRLSVIFSPSVFSESDVTSVQCQKPGKKITNNQPKSVKSTVLFSKSNKDKAVPSLKCCYRLNCRISLATKHKTDTWKQRPENRVRIVDKLPCNFCSNWTPLSRMCFPLSRPNPPVRRITLSDNGVAVWPNLVKERRGH